MPRVIMVTGGGRSGKSNYALSLAMKYEKRFLLATAEAFDEEMHQRIEKHKTDRKNAFTTIEEALDIAGAISRIREEANVILIDCITVWLGNIMHYHRGDKPGDSGFVNDFLKLLNNPPCDLIIVTNEVGLGIIPADKESRKFRDLAGRINQAIAKFATEVYFIVSGLPLVLKNN